MGNTELVMQTGKSMDMNLYLVEVHQQNGAGVIKISIGKEEAPAIADISVENWKVVDASEFEAPLPGFTQENSMSVAPTVDPDGNGVIVDYNDPDLYFPKPYSKIVTSLFVGDYGSSFLTFDQCKRSWEIVTGQSVSVCLDPKPEDVKVYLPAFLCDLPAPEMCDLHKTVKDLYEKDYACNAQHDTWYADVDFYKAKCNITTLV